MHHARTTLNLITKTSAHKRASRAHRKFMKFRSCESLGFTGIKVHSLVVCALSEFSCFLMQFASSCTALYAASLPLHHSGVK